MNCFNFNSVNLVVIDSLLVEEGEQASFQVLTPADLEIKNEERFEGYWSLLASVNVKFVPQYTTKDLSD